MVLVVLVDMFFLPDKVQGGLFIYMQSRSKDVWLFVWMKYHVILGGSFKHLLSLSLSGEMIQFDYSNSFQMGWKLKPPTSIGLVAAHPKWRHIPSPKCHTF